MFLIRATISDCRAPITDLRFAAFPVLTGNTRPFSEDRPRPTGPIAAHRLPCRRIGRARRASGGGAVQSVRSLVRVSAAPARPGSRRPPAGADAAGVPAISGRSLPRSALPGAAVSGPAISTGGWAWRRRCKRSRCLRRPVERPRRCPAASRSGFTRPASAARYTAAGRHLAAAGRRGHRRAAVAEDRQQGRAVLRPRQDHRSHHQFRRRDRRDGAVRRAAGDPAQSATPARRPRRRTPTRSSRSTR